jgi:hypothetical protein
MGKNIVIILIFGLFLGGTSAFGQTTYIEGEPDSDDDGIIDSKDDCPLIWGLEAHDGCKGEIDEVVILACSNGGDPYENCELVDPCPNGETNDCLECDTDRSGCPVPINTDDECDSSSPNYLGQCVCFDTGCGDTEKNWYQDNDGDDYYGDTKSSVNQPPGSNWSTSSGSGLDCYDNDFEVKGTDTFAKGSDGKCHKRYNLTGLEITHKGTRKINAGGKLYILPDDRTLSLKASVSISSGLFDLNWTDGLAKNILSGSKTVNGSTTISVSGGLPSKTTLSAEIIEGDVDFKSFSYSVNATELNNII